jgi:hypothetical protein
MKWTMMDACDLNDWMELQQTSLMDHREETTHWCKIVGIKFLVHLTQCVIIFEILYVHIVDGHACIYMKILKSNEGSLKFEPTIKA